MCVLCKTNGDFNYYLIIIKKVRGQAGREQKNLTVGRSALRYIKTLVKMR